MNIISVLAQKGGTGKTATTREIGARLANDGYRVALINADSQDTLTLVLGMQPEPGMSKVLLDDDPAEEWLRPVPREAWAAGSAGELYVLPGDESTAAAGVKLIVSNTPVIVLREKLRDLIDRDFVDYIIIDNPPSIMPSAPWMYTAADGAIIPTGGALEGIRGAKRTENSLDIVSRATSHQLTVPVLGIIPTMMLTRTNLHRKNWGTMQRAWQGKVWPIINYRITWQYAAQFGKSLQVYAPGSEADEEMQMVYETFREQIGLQEVLHVAG